MQVIIYWNKEARKRDKHKKRELTARREELTVKERQWNGEDENQLTRQMEKENSCKRDTRIKVEIRTGWTKEAGQGEMNNEGRRKKRIDKCDGIR